MATQNGKLLDGITQLAGRLVYLGKKRENNRTYIHYRCHCGAQEWMQHSNWGRQKSCGCLTKQILSKHRTVHGHAHPNGSNGTPTYLSWLSMNERCYYKKHKSYADYGGRGISVCKRWRYSFVNFLSDMGERPFGMTIGRKNNDGNYTPKNCQWQTHATQARNRRSSKLLTFRGRTQILEDWAKELNVPRDALGHRINAGWSVEDALTIPMKKQRNSRPYQPYVR